MKYKCTVCGYEYDEAAEGAEWGALPAGWVCPVCGVGKDLFQPEGGGVPAPGGPGKPEAPAEKSPEPPDEARRARTSSDVCAETMSNWGVKWVLGMVGHSNLGMADAVRRQVENGKMRYVGIRHEGAAAFACSAYGKLTGRPAACIAIAGPGSTNLLTGMCDASLDSAPAIALTGQVPSGVMGLKIFQDIDLRAALSAAAASQYEMLPGAKFGRLMSAACSDALNGRGVVQLIMPDDVQTLPAADGDAPGKPRKAPAEPASAFSESDLREARGIIADSEYPVILMGRGCRGAAHRVEELAETLGCPILTTYPAKGMIPDSHPLSCGVQGLSGTAVAAKFMARADCVIAFGAGFSRHTAVPAGKRVVQIDRDAAAIGRRYPVEAAILGGVSEAAPALADSLRGAFRSADSRAEIEAAWAEWRAEKRARAEKSRKGAIDPAAAAAALSNHVPADAIVAVDVGNIAYSFGRYFEAKGQTFIGSWYLGSIGFGLPASIGAWCAAQEPDGEFFGRPVVAVVGDGGLGQYLGDWTTAAKYGMNIKCVVYNNSELAKISAEQKLARMSVWETELHNPSFAEFAKLCSTSGIRADDPETLDAKVEEFFQLEGPAILEIMTA